MLLPPYDPAPDDVAGHSNTVIGETRFYDTPQEMFVEAPMLDPDGMRPSS